MKFLQTTISFPPHPPSEEDARENNPDGLDLYFEAVKWMEENPEVYELFKRFALEAMGKGRSFGIGLITERVRWECFFLYRDEYKINNNHRAYIARRLIHEIPGLGQFIKIRKTRYPFQEDG